MEVPHLKYTDAGPMAPMASAAPAMAQARATAKLGEAIASIGQTGLDIVEKVRVTREAGVVSAFMSNLDEEAARFSMDLTKRPDPEAWVTDWQTRQEEFKARAAELNLSPVARQRLSQELGEWTSDRGIRFETQAFTRMTMEGKARINNSLNYHASRGDVEGMNREKSRMREAGFEESEIEQVERETARIAAVAGLQRDVKADPAGMAKKLADPDFVAKTPGITTADANRLEEQARGEVRQQAYDMVETVNNGMADGTISRPEQIDQRFKGKASPALLERMKADLNTRIDAAEVAKRKTPEYLHEITGYVTAQLDSYNPEVEGFDETFYSLDRAIRTLPEGVEKARLNARLEATRKGAVEQYTEAADETRAQLREAYKGGAFGEGIGRKTAGELLTDGILRDVTKLQARGFTPEQAEEIATQKDSYKSLLKFRELAKDATGFDYTEGFDKQAFDLLQAGKAGVIDYPDKEKINAANAAYGKAVSEFERWHKVNSKATPEQRQAKLHSLMSPEGLKTFQSIVIPPPDFIDVPEPDASGRYGMDGNAGLPAKAYGDGTGGEILPPLEEE